MNPSSVHEPCDPESLSLSRFQAPLLLKGMVKAPIQHSEMAVGLNRIICGSGGLVTKSCPDLLRPHGLKPFQPGSMGFPRQEHWSALPFPYDLYTDLEQGLSLSKCGVILDGISLFLGTRPTMFSSPQDSILSALWGCCVLGLLPFIFFFLSWRVDIAGEEEGKTN